MKLTFLVVATTLSLSINIRAEDAPPPKIPEAPPPDAAAALEFYASQYFSELLEKLHDAKDDTRLKALIAKRYYGNLFMLWFGTHNAPTSRTIEFDLEGNVRAFHRYSKEYGFDALLDYDDPMGWSRLPADANKPIGTPYYNWFVDQTRDPNVYSNAAKKFREFVATVKPVQR